MQVKSVGESRLARTVRGLPGHPQIATQEADGIPLDIALGVNAQGPSFRGARQEYPVRVCAAISAAVRSVVCTYAAPDLALRPRGGGRHVLRSAKS